MVLNNSPIGILKMMVNHAEETEPLRVLWLYFEYPTIIGFGPFVISTSHGE